MTPDARRERLTHSDLNVEVYFCGRVLCYRSSRGWCRLPTGDEVMDRATSHAISGNPDDISVGELRRAIADRLE